MLESGDWGVERLGLIESSELRLFVMTTLESGKG